MHTAIAIVYIQSGIGEDDSALCHCYSVYTEWNRRG